MKAKSLGALVGLLTVTSAFAARAPSTLQQANAYTDSKVAAEASARQTADSAEATARGDADTQEASIRSQSDGALQNQIDAIAGAANGALGAYEADERIGSVLFVNEQQPETIGSGTNAAVVGVITGQGYLVEIELQPFNMIRTLPSGSGIYYLFPQCVGTAYVGSSVESKWKATQGYVYSFRGSEDLYYVPRGSRVSGAGTFQSTRTSFGTCFTTPISNVAYSVATLPNAPNVTGVYGAASRGVAVVFR